jgi:hypothetical protein
MTDQRLHQLARRVKVMLDADRDNASEIGINRLCYYAIDHGSRGETAVDVAAQLVYVTRYASFPVRRDACNLLIQIAWKGANE